MRDVVIVGAGLTGLSAAYELAQHDLDVTLIEVKRHLGGSIQTVEQHGAVLDNTAFAIHNTLDTEWLESLGLNNALLPLSDTAVAFKQGTGSLIDALKSKITATRLMRMAVSSIGELNDGRYSICMENGLMFDAKSLILAVPARYAERMFYGYITPITEKLLDYRYDTLQRVSIVTKTSQTPQNITTPPDMAYTFIHRTDHPARVPDGYTLLQFGIRLNPKRANTPDDIVTFLCQEFDLPDPLTSHVAIWETADPVSCYDDHHAQWVKSIHDQLPHGIALVGSDYSLTPPAKLGIAHLNDRIQQGRSAAQNILNLSQT